MHRLGAARRIRDGQRRVAFSAAALDSHFSAHFSPRCHFGVAFDAYVSARVRAVRAVAPLTFAPLEACPARATRRQQPMITRRRQWIAAAALVTMLNAQLGASVAAAAQGRADDGDGVVTATPIKHVVILIG